MEVKYRKANIDDVQLVFNWANEPVVRNNSFHSQYIPLEEHTNWFQRKIQGGNTLFYIAEIESEPAGMVRFDIGEEDTIINIIIDKKFRGKKLASVFIEDCCKCYFAKSSKPILAYVKSSNVTSIHSFKKAGFSFLKEEIIHNIESQIFIKANG